MKEKILVSILDSKNVQEFIKKLYDIQNDLKKICSNSFDLGIHFDIMDNKFVPNIGTKLEYIKIAKNLGIYSDVHLMVENPIEGGYIKEALKFGADRITIHSEISNFKETIEYLKKQDVEVGVAIKPNTNLDEVEKYKEKFDTLLIMTVEPGFGGQKYIDNMNDKIKEAKKIFKSKKIEIDGGVNFINIKNGIELEIDDFVIGSYLSKSNNIYDDYICLNIEKEILKIERTTNIEFSKRILQIVENGYASDDILLGIRVPDIRKICKKWVKYINLNIISKFLCSDIHEYRQFAIFCLTYIKNSKESYDFLEKNIKYINNWDLTDIAGPNILGRYLLNLSDKEASIKINEYMLSDNIWIKRIGIVIMLEYARNDKIDFVLDNIKRVIYEEYHLFQKATGWVLREAYKKDSKKIYEFLRLKNSEKKLPTILLSYACEKMSKEEKNSIRSVNK